MNLLDPNFISGFAMFLVVGAGLLAVPLATLATLVLIEQFRGRVTRSMAASAGFAGDEAQEQLGGYGAERGELIVERLRAGQHRPRSSSAVPALAQARRSDTRVVGIYVAAATLYVLLLALGWSVATAWGERPMGLAASARTFGVLLLAHATPIVLAGTLARTRNRWPIVVALTGLVGVLWGLSYWSWGTNLVTLWAMVGGLPAAMILLFNGPQLRAVGPVVLAATLFLLFGIGAGLSFSTFYALNTIGPVHFVHPGLAQLPLVDAAGQYFTKLLRLPPCDLLQEAAAFLSAPLDVIHVENPHAWSSFPVKAEYTGILFAPMLVGVVAAWGLVRSLARSYRRRRASDLMLAIDVLMVTFAIWTLSVTQNVFGWTVVPLILTAFAVYRVVVHWSLRRLPRRAPESPPETLLLLRVFGQQRRSESILDDLGRIWRRLGPIQLIAGPDLAASTIEPHEFFEFLNGRLSRAFVTNPADLERRLSVTRPTPDPDGLYRVDDFFCHDDTWEFTVARLSRDANAVLMDVRGFGPAHRGCIAEIEHLVNACPMERIVLLTDDNTDLPLLDGTLRSAWEGMSADSPNATPGLHRLRILAASHRRRATLASLVDLLCIDHDQTEPSGQTAALRSLENAQ